MRTVSTKEQRRARGLRRGLVLLAAATMVAAACVPVVSLVEGEQTLTLGVSGRRQWQIVSQTVPDPGFAIGLADDGSLASLNGTFEFAGSGGEQLAVALDLSQPRRTEGEAKLFGSVVVTDVVRNKSVQGIFDGPAPAVESSATSTRIAFDVPIGNFYDWALVPGIVSVELTTGTPTGGGTTLPNPNQATTTSGEPLNVEITDPAPGAIVGDAPIDVRGSASVGASSTDAAVVYVVDVSGSTSSGGNDCNGDGVIDAADNLNPTIDSQQGSVLDCEIAAVRALNASLGVTPTSVGLVLLGSSAAAADVDPAAAQQDFTTPQADNDGNGSSDIDELFGLLTFGGLSQYSPISVSTGTDFADALTVAADVLDGRPASQSGYVFFLSDGEAPAAPVETERLNADGVQVNTYSIGGGSAGCGVGSPLLAIADGANGTCFEVDDPSNLTATLTSGPADLSSVVVSLDGAAGVPASFNALGQWSVQLPPVSVGQHVLRATAEAADGTTVSSEIAIERTA